jgi:hypothetical protein
MYNAALDLLLSMYKYNTPPKHLVSKDHALGVISLGLGMHALSTGSTSRKGGRRFH